MEKVKKKSNVWVKVLVLLFVFSLVALGYGYMKYSDIDKKYDELDKKYSELNVKYKESGNKLDSVNKELEKSKKDVVDADKNYIVSRYLNNAHIYAVFDSSMVYAVNGKMYYVIFNNIHFTSVTNGVEDCKFKNTLCEVSNEFDEYSLFDLKVKEDDVYKVVMEKVHGATWPDGTMFIIYKDGTIEHKHRYSHENPTLDKIIFKDGNAVDITQTDKGYKITLKDGSTKIVKYS